MKAVLKSAFHLNPGAVTLPKPQPVRIIVAGFGNPCRSSRYPAQWIN
jgi:hypothetical protein